MVLAGTLPEHATAPVCTSPLTPSRGTQGCSEDAPAGIPQCKAGIKLEHASDWRVQKHPQILMSRHILGVLLCVTAQRRHVVALMLTPKLSPLARGAVLFLCAINEAEWKVSFCCFCWPSYSIQGQEV